MLMSPPKSYGRVVDMLQSEVITECGDPDGCHNGGDHVHAFCRGLTECGHPGGMSAHDKKDEACPAVCQHVPTHPRRVLPPEVGAPIWNA